MRRRVTGLFWVVALALAVAACRGGPAGPTGAFGSPIDFAYACEGDGRTAAPSLPLDETARRFLATRMCPDVTATLADGTTGATRGYLFGAVLNRHRPGVSVIQMNPAARGGRRVLDADPFVPGFTPIPVGDEPIRILRADDWGSFYVISAGSRSVTRVVIEGFQTRGDELTFDTTSFDLPGQPSAALMRDGELWVAAANRAEIWRFDVAADPLAPSRTTLALPAPVEDLQVLGDDVLVTWVNRPVESLLDADGVRVEAGIRPACSDGIDNDGDGLTDAEDPDCWGPADTSEEGPLDARPSDDVEPPAHWADGPPACADRLDNDGDGLIDAEDPACDGGDEDGELTPECSDGIDNDGDGLTDAEDESCYGPYDTSEGQLAPFGPYGATGFDAGDLGRFVYVADAQRGRLAVFDATTGLERVVVPAHAAELPGESYPAYRASADPLEVPPIRRPGEPAPALQGEQDLLLPAPVGADPTSSRLRGEVWPRLLQPDPEVGRPAVPFGRSGDERWLPPACSPDFGELCVQPEADDANWYVFLPRLDGRIQLVEAIRRGEVLHRFAQTTNNPADRGTTIRRPSLRLRGRSVPVGSSVPEGYPFLGPRVQEPLEEAVPEESPPLFRRWGIWPPDDPEQAPTETWFVTYEGVVPGTDAPLGRLASEDTFYDPKGRFCELGVEPGDWLALEVAPESVSPELRLETPVTTEDGEACATKRQVVTVVEVPVVAVGQTTLEVDPAGARLRPVEPELDEDAIADSDASVVGCRVALRELRDVLGRPDRLVATDAFEPANLPRRLLYSVRAGGVWTVVGSRSGFLHRNVWDAEAGSCAVDEEAPPEQQGRVAMADLRDGVVYGTCPPGLDVVGEASVAQSLVEDHVRFRNWSFALDVFPGCESDADGNVSLVPPQRDTRWTFVMEGPDRPTSVTAQGAILGPRIPLLDFRREQIQLDTATGRVHHLQVRPGQTSLQATYE